MENIETIQPVDDIMIVKMEENDYYVSTKIKGKKPYPKFLLERSKISKHFSSLEKAYEHACILKENLSSSSPNCEIIEINIEDFSKKRKPKYNSAIFGSNNQN